MLKIHQIRNATIIIEYNNQFILVDPMLAPKGKLPSLKYFTLNRKRNPLVELPAEFEKLKTKINSVLITHCQRGHFDHLDSYGYSFLRETNLRTYASRKDKNFLSKRNVNVEALEDGVISSFMDGQIETVPALHGRGFMGTLMEHGRGFFIRFPDLPSIYLMGDTVLTPEIEAFIKKNQPDCIVAPAGSARFDFGEEILMTPDELKTLAEISDGKILANHLDAIDHCRQTRASLKEFIRANDLGGKIIILNDGEEFSLISSGSSSQV